MRNAKRIVHLSVSAMCKKDILPKYNLLDMIEFCYKRKRRLLQYRNSPFFHPIFIHFVPWHLGQGGKTSELSSNLITS